MELTTSGKLILEKAESTLDFYINKARLDSVADLIKSARVCDTANDPGAPPQKSLNDLLNNVVELPGSTSIVAVPASLTDPQTGAVNKEMLKMLKQVRTLESYISVLTAYCLYNEHPSPYDISKPAEASSFTQATAKWRNHVITGGAVRAMAKYLPVSQITAQSFSKEVTSATLHLGFLTTLFGGFNLPAKAIRQLDSILTGVVDQMKKVELSFEKQTTTLDHFISYYYFDVIEGTGGDSGIPAMYDCKIRLMYLHVDQQSWRASVGKSSVNHFGFHMNYYDMDTVMGDLSDDVEAINSAIKQLTSKTDEQISAITSPKTIEADPKKS